jgi:hypothetical protein
MYQVSLLSLPLFHLPWSGPTGTHLWKKFSRTNIFESVLGEPLIHLWWFYVSGFPIVATAVSLALVGTGRNSFLDEAVPNKHF